MTLRKKDRLLAALGPAGACSRCGASVREWFLERFPEGGIFAGPEGSTRESICRHCNEGWPYPAERELEDDYVDRLKAWRAEQRKLDEQRPPADAGKDQNAAKSDLGARRPEVVVDRSERGVVKLTGPAVELLIAECEEAGFPLPKKTKREGIFGGRRG
ncbi:MAG: hypothetical protein HY744_05825 [Deltaproteobacteria bacterium]|nr:hypothetical protein [Deltaproteobacteria bacterium]